MKHTTNPSNPRDGERGMALVISILFATVILALVGATLTSGIAVKRQARFHNAAQEAQLAAESGVHLTLARLSNGTGGVMVAAGGVQGVMRGSGPRAPRYNVRLDQAGADGIDNDLDQLVDEADEADMLEVTSTGSFDGVRRTVRVTLLARYRTPQLPAATYFADPSADLNFNGNSFLISGYDIDLNGNPTGDVAPGVGVNGLTQNLIDQIRNQQQGNVVGAGEDPSVHTVPALDINDLVVEGARSANVVLEPGAPHEPSEPGAWGTVDSPAIVFGNGTIKIANGAHGAGIMIVNGNLDISGGFVWHGLIIVGGEVIFRGGGGQTRLTGSLVIENHLNLEGADPTSEGGLEVSGTVDVMLSLQTIARMTQAFATYTILNWREGPNPLEEAQP